jgi:hypothetical protein
VGRECFDGRGPGGPDDLDDETMQCIVNTLGRMPSGPEDMTEEEKRQVGRECFGDDRGGPESVDDLDEETRQCIIGILGELPDSPDDLSKEDKQRVGRECFPNERERGRATPVASGLNETARQCMVDVLGRMPSNLADLTDEEKKRLGQECFGRESRAGQRGGGEDREGRGGRGTRPRTAPSAAAPQPQAGADEPETGAEEPATAGTSQPEAGGEEPGQATAGQPDTGDEEPSPAVAPEPEPEPPQPTLNQEEQDIQKLVTLYNQEDGLGVGFIISRFSGIKGSRTAGLILLNEVNHLLVKGKDVTGEEWSETFSELSDNTN